MNKNKIIAVVFGIIIICAVLAAGFLYWQKSKVVQKQIPSPVATISSSPTPSPETITVNPMPKVSDIFLPPSVPPTGYSVPVPNATAIWKGDGVLMPDLKLILGNADSNNFWPAGGESGSVNYYDVGVRGANKIILAVVPALEMGNTGDLFFEQASAGYIFMEKVSDSSVYNLDTKFGYVLSSKVIGADTATYYEGIVGPADFTYRGIKLEQQYLSPSDLFKDYLKGMPGYVINKIDTVPSGDLYLQQRATTGTPQFYLDRYILKLPSGLYTEYNINYDFFSDNLVPNITWNDGTKNQDSYHQDAHLGGCGNPGSFVISAINVSESIEQTGTTATGQAIYELKDVNDPIIKFFYDMSGGTYNDSTGQFDKIPLQDWYTHHPVVFYKNSLGEYVIFTNDKYGLQAECGKPVIYLYPTQTTNVKVQVGADITKSEPAYDNGWQVEANPNGTLITADGTKYGSLFWEGIGHGDYPSITEGFVVPQNQLKTAIKYQLKELGLSGKESDDFLFFWLPKMPNTPYVRLTWFTTEQLNELAPLIVLPKPDTLIRVFLDFQGLQNNILLPIQHLTALPREGFTVVEWGGILRK